MKNTVTERLLRSLMEIESMSGDESRVLVFLEQLLRDEQFEIQRIPVTEETFCLLATMGKPVVVLQAHIDTVQPYVPFSEDDERIFGRGSCDTKGSAATMLVAALEAKKNGLNNFGILFTVEEETTFRGAIAASKVFSGTLPYFIVGEPTSLQPVTAHYGIETYTISATGIAAHTSMPEKGVNAIDGLIKNVYEPLKRLQLGANTLASVVQIRGGIADNIVPAAAQLVLSMRIAPGDETDYEQEIRSLVGECTVTRGAFLAPVQSSLPAKLAFLGEGLTVRYCTELAFFRNGCILGPGDIRQAHAADEFVLKEELAQAVVLYGKILEAFQSQN